MKKKLIQLLAFIFSPVISAIKEVSAKTDEMVTQNNLETAKILKVQAQLLTVISRKAAMPLLMTARGIVINMIAIKKFAFECIWDHVYTLEFDLKIDNASAGKFSFDLERIANDEAIKSKEDKAVIAFTKKFLLQNSFFNNGDNIKISIVDYIAESATTLLMRNLPHQEVLFHSDLDVICYSALINAMKPFYEKEKKALEPVNQEAEQQTETKIFPINSPKEES